MQKQSFTVTFDDGHVVTAEMKSRDLAALERDGFDIQAAPPVQGTYTLVHAVLQRLARTGALDFDPPATPDALMDCADIEEIEAAEGEGSGQAPVSG